MDPSGMMNEGAPFTLAEIWPFPLNGDSSTTRSGVPFAGHNLSQQFADSNLTGITATTRGNPARMSHALSQAVIAGISGARKRREDATDEESAKVVVSTSNCNGATEGENKRQKKSGCGDEAEAGSPGTEVDQKKQLPEPSKDYIHVRARRGQATDSHSLAERARREKISERMKILQDLVPGCNKVIGKALVLDEIINYIQSLQRQVEFLSMKLEAVNSRMNPGIEVFPPKEYGQQAFENPGMQFGSQTTREYSRGASPEWLHMQLGGGFERTS